MASSAAQNGGGGLVRFDRFVEAALYDPDSGFFATGGGAGRAGADFLTSPEVGPLFGAVVARWLDARWHELGRPDPFVVVEAAAGRGALALAVLAASPACAGALRYLCVERSAVLRDRQREHLPIRSPLEVVDGSLPGPLVGQLAELPDGPFDGVVIANELLDNLAFRLLERTPTGLGRGPRRRQLGVHSAARCGRRVRARCGIRVRARRGVGTRVRTGPPIRRPPSSWSRCWSRRTPTPRPAPIGSLPPPESAPGSRCRTRPAPGWPTPWASSVAARSS